MKIDGIDYISPLSTLLYHLDTAIKRVKRVQEGVEEFWEKDSEILPHRHTCLVRINLDYASNCLEAVENELSFWRMKDENRKNGKEGYWDKREKREVYDEPEKINERDEKVRETLEKVCPNCGRVHASLQEKDKREERERQRERQR